MDGTKGKNGDKMSKKVLPKTVRFQLPSILVLIAFIVIGVFLLFFLAGVFEWAFINEVRFWLRERLINNKILFDILVSLAITSAGFILTLNNVRKAEGRLEAQVRPHFSGEMQKDGTYNIMSVGGAINNGSVTRYLNLSIFYQINDSSEKGQALLAAGFPEGVQCAVLICDPIESSPEVAGYSAKNEGFAFGASRFQEIIEMFDEQYSTIAKSIEGSLEDAAKVLIMSWQYEYNFSVVRADGIREMVHYFARWCKQPYIAPNLYSLESDSDDELMRAVWIRKTKVAFVPKEEPLAFAEQIASHLCK